MPVLAIGLSHHHATVDELTRFTACAQQVASQLRAAAGVHGLIMLSTCNRCEFYLDADRFHQGVQVAKQLLVGVGVGDLVDALATYAAQSAVEHLFQVACGLDSMVVGESEIVGQVRSALSEGAGQASPALHRLFQMALTTSRLITNSTNLATLGRNVATVALDLVESRYGRLVGQQALLIGTGAYAGVVTADLVRRGVQVYVHSRSGRAEAFARAHPVTALAADDVSRAISSARVVIACSGNGPYALTVQEVTTARAGVFGVLPVVDLALGRDVAPELALTPGVDLIDLDTIGAHAPAGHYASLAEANRLVSQAVDTYLEVERGRLADPAVTAIRAHVDQIVAAELDSVVFSQPPEIAAAVSRSLRRVTNALLHTPSLRAAEMARSGDLEEFTRALERVFGIEVGP